MRREKALKRREALQKARQPSFITDKRKSISKSSDDYINVVVDIASPGREATPREVSTSPEFVLGIHLYNSLLNRWTPQVLEENQVDSHPLEDAIAVSSTRSLQGF